MSYITVAIRRVDVIGRIWQPLSGVCAMSFNLTMNDVQDIRGSGDGQLTRDGVRLWLSSNAGDFQSIQDFRADTEDFLSDWADPNSEYAFLDCMYPANA